jgi:CBS domain-containing protein
MLHADFVFFRVMTPHPEVVHAETPVIEALRKMHGKLLLFSIDFKY